MIIQIRGTSGSGKTTAMKAIIAALPELHPQYLPGRKQPVMYTSQPADTVILGGYETTCGGCDNIGSAAQVFKSVQYLLEVGWGHILCEGLLLSEDTKWALQLKDLRVIYLVTPLDECLRRVESRRKAAGNEKPLNPDNTTKRVGVIERSRVKLLEAGVTCVRASSTQAPGIVLKWLGVSDAGRTKLDGQPECRGVDGQRALRILHPSGAEGESLRDLLRGQRPIPWQGEGS